MSSTTIKMLDAFATDLVRSVTMHFSCAAVVLMSPSGGVVETWNGAPKGTTDDNDGHRCAGSGEVVQMSTKRVNGVLWQVRAWDVLAEVDVVGADAQMAWRRANLLPCPT
jgi:hypothetical protein